MPKKSRPQTVRKPTKRQLARWQREQRLQRAVIFSAAFIIALIVAIPAYGYYKEVFAKGREAIASVNDKGLTMDEYVRLLSFRQYQMDLGLNYLQNQAGDQSSSKQLTEQLQMERAVLPTQVVFDWVDGEVMALAAPKLDISVSSAEVWQEVKKQLLGEPEADETVDEVKRDADAQEGLKSLIESTGITADQYKRTVEIGLLRQKIDERLRSQIVTPTVQVRVQLILANGQDEIENAYKRIQAGESFAEVAKEVSIDAKSKDNGGELGWVPKGLRAAEFDETVFAMSPGQMSEPFKSSEGYYIVKVLERDEARDLDSATLDMVKAGAMERWLAEQRQNAKIDYAISSEKQFWAQEKISKDREKKIKKAQQQAR